MEKLVDFFRTGEIKVPHEQTVEASSCATR